MIINLVTSFPHIYDSFLQTSLIKKAIDSKILQFNLIDLKDFGIGNYNQIDDRPYGGGAGMILRVDVLDKALDTIKNKGTTVALSPKGEIFTQKLARTFSKLDSITLISSRFEGFDERIFSLCDKSISIGNYVTMGGEVPSLVLIESIVRLIPGVIQNKDSLVKESFSNGKNKEYPQYTKPKEYKGMAVPDILLSGNHGKIDKWREQNAK